MSDEKYQSALNDIRLAHTGDKDAVERLVVENDALVRFCVNKFKDRGKEYEDLYQLGRLGLVRAIDNFDESYGVRFSTYAVPMIMGEIRKFLRDDGQLRVSRTIKENAKKALEYAKCGNFQISYICENTGMSREDVTLALGSLSPVRSLNERLSPDSDAQIQDVIGVNPFEEVDRNLLIGELLNELDEIERKLIRLRYFERMTQARVAGELGLTQVQVSRMEKKLLARMRARAV